MKKKLTLLMLLGILHNFSYSIGPRGLQNCGNTCFINSVLQCFYNIRPFKRLLISDINPFNISTTNQQCAYHLVELFREINKPGQSTLQCTGILGKFTNSAYAAMGVAPATQQDAEQLIRTIFSVLEQEKSYQDKINELFNFVLSSQLSCPGAPVSINRAREIVLPLHVQQPDGTVCKNLKECLNTFIQPESVTYKVDGVDKDCLKTIIFGKPSPYLLIMLKRYVLRADGSTQKIQNRIDIPLTLVLESNFFEQIVGNQTYELIAFAYHMGEIIGGHYTAGIKSNDNSWYDCNDSAIYVFDPQGHYFTMLKDTAYFYVFKKKERLAQPQPTPTPVPHPTTPPPAPVPTPPTSIPTPTPPPTTAPVYPDVNQMKDIINDLTKLITVLKNIEGLL